MNKNIYELLLYLMIVLPCVVLIWVVIKWLWITELRSAKKKDIKEKEPLDRMWNIGNVLVTRSHDKFIVIGEDYAISYEGRIAKHNYNENLRATWSGDGSMDIMAVYSTPWNLREVNKLETNRLIWEREEL